MIAGSIFLIGILASWTSPQFPVVATLDAKVPLTEPRGPDQNLATFSGEDDQVIGQKVGYIWQTG